MKKILLYISIILTLTTVTLPAFANTANAGTIFESIPKPDTLPGPNESDQENDGTRNILLDVIIPRFTVGFIGFVGGVALVFVIIGGVRFLTAYGDDEAVGKGKKQIFYGLVGFLVALLAYTIVTIIINLRFSGDTTTNEQPTTTPEQPGIETSAEFNEDLLNPGAIPEFETTPDENSQAA